MPYRNLTLEELAQHIGMDAREVRKLADRGKLPGQKVGGQWRFNRAQMLDWLQREMQNLDEQTIRNLERATATGPDLLVNSMLPNEAVELNLPARSKASVVRELTAVAERTGLVYDPRALVAALEEREALGSTALPGGVALPHPLVPMPEATAEPLLALARVPAGIAFGAPDGRMTDIFVLVVSHEDRGHLNVLARLSLMFTTSLAEQIRACESSEEALRIVLAAEQAVMSRRR